MPVQLKQLAFVLKTKLHLRLFKVKSSIMHLDVIYGHTSLKIPECRPVDIRLIRSVR